MRTNTPSEYPLLTVRDAICDFGIEHFIHGELAGDAARLETEWVTIAQRLGTMPATSEVGRAARLLGRAMQTPEGRRVIREAVETL